MTVYRSAAGREAVMGAYRTLLAGWPVPTDQRHVPTRHGDTFVVSSGPADAPPLVALSGSGGNTATWRHSAPAWTRHLRLHAVDVIGEPGLSAETRPPMTGPDHADWLDDVLDGLGVDRTAVVAVSLGAWIAIDHATRRPGRLDGLALLTPAGIGRRKVSALLKAAALIPLGAMDTAMRVTAGPIPPGLRDSEELRFTKDLFRHFTPRTNPIPTFTDDQLTRLTTPLLAVVGARDAMLDSHGTARRLTTLLPQADVRVLPDAGHLLPDQTDQILRFLLARKEPTP